MGHTDPGGQGKRARPNPHLKAQRARLGLTQQEVAEALAALAWEHDHEELGVDADMVSKWERGVKRPRRLYRRLLCMLYHSTEVDLGLRQTQGGAPADGFSGEDVNRREFLRAAVVAPEVLRRVLRGAGGEAMEFTRMAGTSGVGAGTFDHLEAVLSELRRSYYEQPSAEQFAVARAYRTRVQELIQGRHTFSEGRQLYVDAALLDEVLIWCAQDLGDALTAEAYAIDCLEHADQAGHDELCAWAADQMASIAIYANRPERAASAARRGIERAPAAHPVAVRLRAQAARAHARLGQRDECERSFSQAQDLYDRLPSTTPIRFGEDTRVQADQALTSHPASSHIWLADFKRAKRYAEQAVTLHEATPAGSRDLRREAIARIDLGIALAELGVADEAIGQGRLALASPRVSESSSVRSRAAELDAVLTRRYPQVSAAREFHEQYGNLVRATR
jgi:tetratricopeptide (TPR) repeat protein/DNA-binding transcriptional regulator YiaG